MNDGRRTSSDGRPLRIAVQTLGCPKNTVDSASLISVLQAAGFHTAVPLHRADVLVVNTCGFVDDAKLESVSVLMEAVRWKLARPGRRVLAMGCLTQRDGAELAAGIPELDGVFGIGEWTRLLETLKVNPVAPTDSNAWVSSHVAMAGPGSAYLRVSDGCSHACAFCSIPQMRGLYRSEPMDELLSEAQRVVAGGVREIILIGQETTSYGVDLYRERRLVELCHRLSDLKNLHWIRILYTHPPSAPPELLDELARVPKLAPYLDFPVEHASNRMLKLMNRRTTVSRMRESITAFRAARPEAGVRTAVMVGFPGETDGDFAELLEFMAEMRFERAGVFVYSPQDDTSGASLPDCVEEGVAFDRLDQIMRLQRRICLEKHQSLVGRTIGVLIERQARGASWGRGPWDAPEIDGRVRTDGALPVGEIVPVTVTRAFAYQVDGRAVPADVDHSRRESCATSPLPFWSSR
jgi:ribosomal protein S12 methylthiotransferase